MKVTVNNLNVGASYPVLKTTSKGLIVLFSSPATGAVIKAIPESNSVGHHSHCWDEGQFTPLASGSQVILEND